MGLSSVSSEHRGRGRRTPLVLALGEDDLRRRAGDGLEDRPHEEARAEDRAVELLLVGAEVRDGAGGDAVSMAARATAVATTPIRRGSKGLGIR
jgi:hypothetical protein